MDRNFYLLTPDEVKLIQDISMAGLPGQTPISLFGEDFTFAKVRDRIDVVIEDDASGFPEFLQSLQGEETDIINSIEEERRKRQEDNNEEGEPFPRLGNFDDRDNPEPFDTTWDEDVDDDCDPVDDSDPLDGKWLAERERERKHAIEEDRWRERFHDRPFQESRLEAEDFRDLSSGTVIGRLNNYELKQLDARLGQIKMYRKRLIPVPGSHAWWSGNLLGCYQVRRDMSNGNIISRTVYLFISNIRNYAAANGVSTSNVLATTFTHEMFHAYYDDIKSRAFIVSRMYGVREIEEAMAEFGMLSFIEQFHHRFLGFAKTDVKNKLTSGVPYLHCYGMGYQLFSILPASGALGQKYFSLYQKIQPAPRYGIRLVERYIKTVNRRSLNVVTCQRLIYRILDYFDRRIKNVSQHYIFAGYSGGESNKLVFAVLDYYIGMVHPDFPTMETHFDNNASRFGKYHIFEIGSRIAPKDMNSKYRPDPLATLADGSVVYPAQQWFSERGKNTEAFINQVNHLYRIGVLDRNITIVR